MAKKKEKFVKVPKTEVKESVKTHVHDIFIIVEKNEQCFVALGDKIVSKNVFATVEEAKEYVDSKPWELIVNATCAVYEIVLKETAKNNKQSK